MVKKYWHFIFPVLMLGVMVFIFCMSAQPADESSMTSGQVVRLIAKLLLTNFTDYSEETQGKILRGMTFIVRKTAHFTEYACLGFLGYIWLHRIRHGWLYALCGAVAYAVTDEIHQIFTPGRACEVRDMLVDSSGAFFGVAGAFVLLSVIYCLRHREVQYHLQWGGGGEPPRADAAGEPPRADAAGEPPRADAAGEPPRADARGRNG